MSLKNSQNLQSPSYLKNIDNRFLQTFPNKKQQNLLCSTGIFTNETLPKKLQRSSNINNSNLKNSNKKIIRKSKSKQFIISLSRVNSKDANNNSFLSIDDPFLTTKFQHKKQVKTTSRVIHPQNNNFLHQLHKIQNQSFCEKSLVNTCQDTSDYYKYWKSKAHEYLDENFKLRQQNNSLKRQIQEQKSLKFITEEKIKSNNFMNQSNNNINVQRQERSFKYLQTIFKNKMDQLEKQIKQKNIKIVYLEDKILQLNRKIQGQQQRTQLIQRLANQIQQLTQQNIFLKKKSQSIQHYPFQQNQQKQSIKSYSKRNSKQKYQIRSSKNNILRNY